MSNPRVVWKLVSVGELKAGDEVLEWGEVIAIKGNENGVLVWWEGDDIEDDNDATLWNSSTIVSILNYFGESK